MSSLGQSVRSESAQRHPGQIVLADTPPFHLGNLQVRPASREVIGEDGSRRTLEPRIMQVLVALAEAGGEVVTRDELNRRCWGGTVVGADAANRAISQLRRLANGPLKGAFTIETIPKVGYRLTTLPTKDGGEDGHSAQASKVTLPFGWTSVPIAVALVLAALLAWPLIRPATTGGPLYSVSVTPSDSSSQNNALDAELLSALTKLDVPVAGGQHALALGGAVERGPAGLRVISQLRAADGQTAIWGGATDWASDDPATFARLVESVAAVVTCTVEGANDHGRSLSGPLLSQLARACDLAVRGQSQGVVDAARALTRQSPELTAGWFLLADHALKLSRMDGSDELRAEALRAAKRLAALRPQAQEGLLYQALAMDPRQPVQRERTLRRAAQMSPLFGGAGDSYLGDFLVQVGRLEEGFRLHRKEELKQPDLAIAHGRVFFSAAATERWPIAEQAMREIETLDPVAMPLLRWRQAVWTGDWKEAERWIPLELPAQENAMRAVYRALTSGDAAKKEAAAAQVLALPESCCMELRIEMLTQLDRTAEAVDLLDKLETGRTPGGEPGVVGLFLWDPVLRPLWFEPRMHNFLRRNGWISYWRDSGSDPDICDLHHRPQFCTSITS